MNKKSGVSTRFKPGNKHAWKPGKSGNPNGRPKSITLSEAYQKLLKDANPQGATFAEEIAQNICRIAKGTSTSALAAAREIADRTEGKTLPQAEVGDRVDSDLLAAARKITTTRLIARMLGLPLSQLPHVRDDDGLIETLNREVNSSKD